MANAPCTTIVCAGRQDVTCRNAYTASIVLTPIIQVRPQTIVQVSEQTSPSAYLAAWYISMRLCQVKWNGLSKLVSSSVIPVLRTTAIAVVNTLSLPTLSRPSFKPAATVAGQPILSMTVTTTNWCGRRLIGLFIIISGDYVRERPDIKK